jgi:hypothetical protein
MNNEESEMEVVMEVEDINRLSMYSTDPLLLVQVRTNNEQIENTSRTTMASFTATVMTLLDAAAAEEDRSGAGTFAVQGDQKS